MWWLIAFDGVRAGQTGYLRWDGDTNTVLDADGNAVEACDYHVIDMDVAAPGWA